MKILKGHDAVVVSVKWNENDVRRVIDTIRKSGVKRALFVVGAGSLLRKDGKRHYDFMSEKGVQPPTSLPALQAYEEIQKIDDLDWTAISPPASIPAGQRTGKFQRRPRQADRERQGREPHQPRGFRGRHRRRDREAQARPQAVHGGVLRRDGSFRNSRFDVFAGGAPLAVARHGLPDREPLARS